MFFRGPWALHMFNGLPCLFIKLWPMLHQESFPRFLPACSWIKRLACSRQDIRTHKLIKVLNHTTARLFHKVKVSKALLLYIQYRSSTSRLLILQTPPLTNKENNLPRPSFNRSCLSILLLHQAEVHQVHLFPQLEHVIRLPAHAGQPAVRSVEELNPGSEGKLHLTFRLKKHTKIHLQVMQKLAKVPYTGVLRERLAANLRTTESI